MAPVHCGEAMRLDPAKTLWQCDWCSYDQAAASRVANAAASSEAIGAVHAELDCRQPATAQGPILRFGCGRPVR